MKETNQNTLSGGLNPELNENTNNQLCSCGSGEPENECCEITPEHIINELQSMDIDWLFELDDFILFVKEQKKNEKTKDEYEWEEIVGDYLYSVQQNLYQEDSSQGQWIDRYDLYDDIEELCDERVLDELKVQSKLVLDCLDRGVEKKEKPIDTITTSIERTRELFEITERRNQKIIQDWSSLIENHEDNYEYLHNCLIQYKNVVELGFEGDLVECNTLIGHLEEIMRS
jgi:hypothetical protein